MIGLALGNMIGASLVMLLVLAARGPTARYVGAEAAYALWLLPLLRLLLPPIASPLPVALPALVAMPAPVLTAAPVVPMAPLAAPPPPATGNAVDVISLVLALWAGGALVFAIWQHATYSAFALHLGRDGRPGRPPVHGGVRVVESDAVDGPVAIGFVRRRIVVPLEFLARYTPAEQRLALDHELIHHRRFDLWANLAALAMLALNWFNPIAHVAYRAFRADQELACDAAIARRAPGERHDYACALVKAASQSGLVAACPLTQAATLKRRLRMMNDHRRGRGRAAGGIAAFASLGLAGLALSTPGAARQDAPVPPVRADMPRHESFISAADQRLLDEKCANGREESRTRSYDRDVIHCGNGKVVVADPETRAVIDRTMRKARAYADDVVRSVHVDVAPAVAAAQVAAADAVAQAERSAAIAPVAGVAPVARVAPVDELRGLPIPVDRAALRESIRASIAQARAQIAAIDVRAIRAEALASARAGMEAARISRAQMRAALDEARAEIDKADIGREMREADEEAAREADEVDTDSQP